MCRCLKERCRNNHCSCRKAGKKCDGCWCINCQNLSEPKQVESSPEKSIQLPAEPAVSPTVEKQKDPLPTTKQKPITPAQPKNQVKVDTVVSPQRHIKNHGDCCECKGDCSYEENCKCVKEGLTCRDSSCLNKDFTLRELDPPLTIMLER